MDTNWRLMKEGVEGTPDVVEWIGKQLARGEAVGVDPKLISSS